MRNEEKRRAYARKYYHENRAAQRSKNKKWAARNKEHLKDYKWKRTIKKYGLSPETYALLFQDQDGNCAIFGLNQSRFAKRLYVDHNHKTGRYRELLCVNCNMLIGHAMENVEILSRSILYLKKHGV